MALTSTLTLAQVETAITNCLTTGQSYSRVGFSKTNVSLDTLMKMRQQIINEDATNSSTGCSFVDDFSGVDGGESNEWGD